MDPLSILAVSGATLSIVQVVNNFVKVLQALRNVNDSKYEEIYWLAIAEREKSLAWARKIQLSGTSILPEQQERVNDVVHKLEIFFRQVEKSLAKLYEPDGRRITFRLLANRLAFQTGGYDNLKQQLQTITAMNEALVRVAPVLPMYADRESPSRVGESERQSVDLSIVQAIPMPTDRTRSEIVPVSPEKMAELRQRVKPVRLSYLYSLCCKTLEEISAVKSLREPFEDALVRLKVWAIGLFDDNILGLDTIFEAEPERHVYLRNFLFKSFVYIVIVEEMLLKHLEEEDAGGFARKFHHDRDNLLIMIGKGDLTNFAIERWDELSQLISEDAYSTTDEEDNRDLELALKTPQIEGESENIVADLSQEVNANEPRSQFGDEVLDSHFNELQQIISHLFKILPTIRSARQSRRLDVEEQEALLSPEATVDELKMQSTSGIVEETSIIAAEGTAMKETGHEEHGKKPVDTAAKRSGPKYELRVVSTDISQHEAYLERIIRRIKILEDSLKEDEDDRGIARGEALAPQLGKQRELIQKYQAHIVDAGPKAAITAEKALLVRQIDEKLRREVESLTLDLKDSYESLNMGKIGAIDTNKQISGLLRYFKSNSGLFTIREGLV